VIALLLDWLTSLDSVQLGPTPTTGAVAAISSGVTGSSLTSTTGGGGGGLTSASPLATSTMSSSSTATTGTNSPSHATHAWAMQLLSLPAFLSPLTSVFFELPAAEVTLADVHTRCMVRIPAHHPINDL
jgi:hypothetical protein